MTTRASRLHGAVRVLVALALLVQRSAHAQAPWRPLLDASLSQWEVWTGVPHASVTKLPKGYTRGSTGASHPPVGLGDPFALFTVRRSANGTLMLNVTGEVFGGLTTRAEFANYHLTFEVQWGRKKWPPRETDVRDSGLLYHCQGPHGAFWKVWMRCLELQIQEGDFGDLHQLAGPSAAVRQTANGWDPSGPLVRTSGRVMRRMRRESPLGQWTRVDLYVVGDRAVHVVNGHVVLALEGAQRSDGTSLTSGKLQVQSEGAECTYRDLRWRPITRLPAAIAAQLKGN